MHIHRFLVYFSMQTVQNKIDIIFGKILTKYQNLWKKLRQTVFKLPKHIIPYWFKGNTAYEWIKFGRIQEMCLS